MEQDYSVTVKSAQSIHQLHAIRMRWLKWLSRPIVAVWDFILECLSFVWNDLILLSYNGMKESVNHRYWLISAAGLFPAFLFIFLFFWLGMKLESSLLYLIGGLLGILPISWANAEIAGILDVKKNTGVDPDVKELPGHFGLGLRSVILLAVFVGVILIMSVLQAVLDLSGLIPHAGFTILGLLAVPLIFASIVIVFSILIILLGTPILGPHLIENDESYKSFPKRTLDSSVSLIQFIAHKWVDILLISYPASFFAALISLVPAALLASAGAVSFYIATGTLSVFESAVNPALSFMALASPEAGIMSYVSGVIWIMSLSVIAAGAVSFSHSCFACIYYRLYYNTNRMFFAKKIIGTILAFIILIPVYALGSFLFSRLF